MEALILAAWLHANTPAREPICPKPFVKAWQLKGPQALKQLRRPCRYQADTGVYHCTKDGCSR